MVSERRAKHFRALLAGSAMLVLALAAHQPTAGAAPARAPERSLIQLAPTFIANSGRVDAEVRFLSTGGGADVFFTASDVRIADARRHRSLWLSFVGARTHAVLGERPTGGRVTFLHRAAASGQALTEPAYRDVVYRNAWPGIDARVTGADSGLKYSFELAPHADPRAIRLRYRGADRISLSGTGELQIEAGGATIIDRAPDAWQNVGDRVVPIDVRFEQHGEDVTFLVGAYDVALPLTIDPTLAYSTYLGGSGYDVGRGIAIDGTGAAYVAGATRSSDFPTTPGTYQTSFRGGTGNTASDAFVAKINAAGTQFDYVTYLGGSGNDEAFGVAVDAAGNAFVTGFTESADFPATSGAYQPSIGLSHHDGFVAKLNSAGTALIYSTFFGLNGSTDPAAVAVDSAGSAYIVGRTFAGNLPVTAGAQPWTRNGQGDAFLLKLDAAGAQATYGTYIGGSRTDAATSVAVDGSGHAFVAGWTRSIDGISSAQVPQPNPGGPSFKSTDGGATFDSVNTPIRTSGSIAFAIDPTQPATVYQGTREQGLLKTTDGGASWFHPSDALSATSIFSIAVNPATPNVVLASGAGNNIVFRSTDGGSTWTQVATNALDLTISPSNPLTVYARNGGVLKSTDGGATWAQVYPITTASTAGIAIDPGNSNIVYVGTGSSALLKTSNGGATWTTLPISGASSGIVISVAVDPTLTSVVWAGFATGEVFRSTDSGSTWTLMSDASVRYPGRMIFDGGTLYISDAGDFITRAGGTGALAKTSDRGDTWSHLLIRGNSTPVLGLAVLNGLIYAGGDIFTDGFLWKIDTNATTNSLVFGTYLGGALDDSAVGIAIDPAGNAVVALETHSADFPTTVSAPTTNSALARVSSDGTTLAASSYVGASLPSAIAKGVAVDASGNAYVTGAFGTSDQGVWVDRVDSSGTDNASFTLNGTQSNVGAPADVPAGIAAGSAGDVFIVGSTLSVDFPTTAGAPQRFYGSGASDAFLAKVSFGSSTPGPVNLALNKPVVVSSTFGSSFAGANAVDGNQSTRWSSDFSDPQWIYVDLQQRFAISEVVLRWETAFGADYTIQISDDASSWTTIRSVVGGDGGVDDLTGLSGTGRYLRVLGTRRGTEWGYSLWELEVYGTAAAAPVDLALHRPVTASSIAFGSSSYAAENAVDGDAATRWSSEFSDPQWIAVDLGKRFSIREVKLSWEAAYGADFEIQVSDDATSWVTIASATNNVNLTNDFIVSGFGRYVRMYGTRRGTPWGYSLWSFEVYGDATVLAADTVDRALGRPASSSSDFSSTYAAAAAVDGDGSTRWSSQFSDPQWISVDLGQPFAIAEVKLSWEAAYGADFEIQVSDDAVNWTTIRSVTNGSGGIDDLAVSGTGRYVRVYGTRRGTQWGYSLWSFEVYGTLPDVSLN